MTVRSLSGISAALGFAVLLICAHTAPLGAQVSGPSAGTCRPLPAGVGAPAEDGPRVEPAGRPGTFDDLRAWTIPTELRQVVYTSGAGHGPWIETRQPSWWRPATGVVLLVDPGIPRPPTVWRFEQPSSLCPIWVWSDSSDARPDSFRFNRDADRFLIDFNAFTVPGQTEGSWVDGAVQAVTWLYG